MTEVGRRTIDEKFEVQVFLVEEAAIAEAAVAEEAGWRGVISAYCISLDFVIGFL